jgi:hypothetical protein
MRKGSFAILAAAVLGLGAGTANADSFIAQVSSVGAGHILTFDDRSQMQVDPAVVAGELKPGVMILVDFYADDDGYKKVHAVRVLTNKEAEDLQEQEMARTRVLPASVQPTKRG